MPILNGSQQQCIRSTFIDLHMRMADMEAMIAQSNIASPLSQYVNDLTPVECKVLEEYFARIRSTILSCMQDADIGLDVRKSSLRWSLQCAVIFMDVSISDTSPQRLEGYGTLSPEGRAVTTKIQNDLAKLISRVSTYLKQSSGRSLNERLAHLDASETNIATLKVLERIIARWQLVEFRPSLETIVRRLESPQFEIAVFGRVSSGKTSLLNHIAGNDVLPVGVTPVTAVPTRLIRGERAYAVVEFAEIQSREIAIKDLHEYASEEGNPGNNRHVTSIHVMLPSPQLQEGVILVDTPGIGSLALAGSAETYAYLPRCDLAIVLIDAGSTLNHEDVSLLRILHEAGIQAQVLLSKADLLRSEDRSKMVEYIRRQLKDELAIDLPVHPISTIGENEQLLKQWFEEEVSPLFAHHRALAEASLQRKTAHLRESVIATLETMLDRQFAGKHEIDPKINRVEVERVYHEADTAIEQLSRDLQIGTNDESAWIQLALREAAWNEVNAFREHHSHDDKPVIDAIRQVFAHRSRTILESLNQLQQKLIIALESQSSMVPTAGSDIESIRNYSFSGMPVFDLSTLEIKPCLQPRWWWTAFPSLAAWRNERRLQKIIGPKLLEYLQLYDRQLRNWAKNSISQLAELYEHQTEFFREQVRRLTGQFNVHDSSTKSDVDALEADLRELRSAGST